MEVIELWHDGRCLAVFASVRDAAHATGLSESAVKRSAVTRHIAGRCGRLGRFGRKDRFDERYFKKVVLRWPPPRPPPSSAAYFLRVLDVGLVILSCMMLYSLAVRNAAAMWLLLLRSIS